MKILHIMVGLPRSGKSTIARSLGYPVVEPDSIRMVLHGTAWKENVEPMVWAIAKVMVESLFLSGSNHVVLDAANHTEKRRKIWQSEQWAIKYHVVETEKAICLERAMNSNKAYLVPVIERMSQDFERLSGNTDC